MRLFHFEKKGNIIKKGGIILLFFPIQKTLCNSSLHSVFLFQTTSHKTVRRILWVLHFHLFCFLLFPAGFQFFQSVFAGQADLAVLDVHDLYDNGIAYGNHVLYLFYPFLVQLGDMY